MKKTNFEKQKNTDLPGGKVCTDVISMFNRSNSFVKQIIVCA